MGFDFVISESVSLNSVQALTISCLNYFFQSKFEHSFKVEYSTVSQPVVTIACLWQFMRDHKFCLALYYAAYILPQLEE